MLRLSHVCMLAIISESARSYISCMWICLIIVIFPRGRLFNLRLRFCFDCCFPYQLRLYKSIFLFSFFILVDKKHLMLRWKWSSAFVKLRPLRSSSHFFHHISLGILKQCFLLNLVKWRIFGFNVSYFFKNSIFWQKKVILVSWTYHSHLNQPLSCSFRVNIFATMLVIKHTG